MLVDSGTVIDILYIRGATNAPSIAAQIGGDVESIDVSVQMMELLREGLVEEVAARPPRWQLTEAGVQIGWDRKARAAG